MPTIKMLIIKGRTEVDIMLLMMDPSEAPMKKKHVPYTEEAIPAVFPIGSIANALLLGSTAKLIPISTAIAPKTKEKLAEALVKKLAMNNTVPTAA